ncbi:tRNA pseudouridine38-40 synthase [Desulfonatronum zhilinae]|nr:tRNA pseudouridine38-40 synthase [Desulfonatronum zhilinae]
MTKIDPAIRLKFQVAYIGTGFHGWQLQDGARTVQGCLEAALERLAGRPVRVHGAGRTDAGVHALGQVAHVDVPANRRDLPWQRALNALLPPDVTIVRLEQVSETFHARFDAIQKTYTYTLWHEPRWLLPQRRAYVWQVGELDRDAMAQSALKLLGRRDWSAFQNRGTPVRSPVRTVQDIHVRAGIYPQESVWLFTADGFLKQMVRNLMGCLVMVGKGRLTTDQVMNILAQGRRESAPATAPARGLCLERVDYRDGSGEVF